MSIDLTAKAYTPDKSRTYRLSIRECSDGFSFAVIDRSVGQCMVLKHLETTIAADVLADSLLQQSYADVLLVTDNVAHVVIPHALYTPDGVAAFLPLDALQRQRAQLAMCDLPDFEAIDVCNRRGCLAVPPTVGTVQYRHPLAQMALRAQQTMRRIFYVDVQPQTTCLLVADYHKLLLSNIVECHTDNDVAYYILATFQTLQLDVEQVPVLLSGRFDATLLQQLQQYVRSVHPVVPMADTQWNADFDGRYYPQFALML